MNNAIVPVSGSGNSNLQYYDNKKRFPAVIDDNLANNIVQALSMKTKGVEIYTIILCTLRSIRVTGNPYELYTLTNKLNMYIKNMPKF